MKNPSGNFPRGLLGVDDGARTRDTQDHNLVLYQLNYIHHYRLYGSEGYSTSHPSRTSKRQVIGVALGGLPGCGLGVAGLAAQEAAPVVVELLDGLDDVGERPVGEPLVRLV